MDIAAGGPVRLGTTFEGSWEDLTVVRDGTVVAIGLKGMNQSAYRLVGKDFEIILGKPRAYSDFRLADRVGAALFTHSEIGVPTQVYLASTFSSLKNAEAITALNPIFRSDPNQSGNRMSGRARTEPQWKVCWSIRPAKKTRGTCACSRSFTAARPTQTVTDSEQTGMTGLGWPQLRPG